MGQLRKLEKKVKRQKKINSLVNLKLPRLNMILGELKDMGHGKLPLAINWMPEDYHVFGTADFLLDMFQYDFDGQFRRDEMLVVTNLKFDNGKLQIQAISDPRMTHHFQVANAKEPTALRMERVLARSMIGGLNFDDKSEVKKSDD